MLLGGVKRVLTPKTVLRTKTYVQGNELFDAVVHGRRRRRLGLLSSSPCSSSISSTSFVHLTFCRPSTSSSCGAAFVLMCQGLTDLRRRVPMPTSPPSAPHTRSRCLPVLTRVRADPLRALQASERHAVIATIILHVPWTPSWACQRDQGGAGQIKGA